LNYSFNPPPAPAPKPVELPPPVAAAPAPEPAPVPPRPVFERLTLSSTELFGFDSAVLRMPQPKLDQIADVLGKHPEVTNVSINGYADRLGRPQYNLKLSQERADAVKNYLVSKGVAADRLVATGKGEADPIEQCEGVKKRAQLIKCLEPNRRVEVEDITVQRRVQ
jgi:OOP family OmpA-OmpF porin